MEYEIVAKPSTSGNPMSDVILERIQQVLGNLVRACKIIWNHVDEDDPWLGILSDSVFVIISTTNRLKVYSPGQLIFGCYMILLIKYTVD